MNSINFTKDELYAKAQHGYTSLNPWSQWLLYDSSFTVINAAVHGHKSEVRIRQSTNNLWQTVKVTDIQSKNCCSVCLLLCGKNLTTHPSRWKMNFLFCCSCILGAFQWTTQTFRNNDMYGIQNVIAFRCVEWEDGSIGSLESMTFLGSVPPPPIIFRSISLKHTQLL